MTAVMFLPGITVVPIRRFNRSVNSYYVPVKKERIEGGSQPGDSVQLLVMAPNMSYPVAVEGRILRVYKNVAQIYLPYRQYKPVIDQAIANGGFLYLFKAVKVLKV
jgi:hypothetical protein